jgi:DNA modification methylase
MTSPEPYYSDDLVTLHHGDCIEVMRSLPDNSVHAVVTDPPYGLEFMGKGWDGADGFRRSLNAADAGRENVFGRASRTSPEYKAGEMFGAWCALWAAECFRVLKPGGHILAFGGTRTWHRLAMAVEDAGFEIRDSIAWLYGSGFPKSMDVSKAIDKAAGADREPDTYTGANGKNAVYGKNMGGGQTTAKGDPVTAAAAAAAGWGTALKPAFEPIVVGRKPFNSTVAANFIEHGTGALNIAATRVGNGSESRGRDGELSSDRRYTEEGAVNLSALPGVRGGSPDGRWPTNVLLDASQAKVLDQQAPDTGGSGPASGPTRIGGSKSSSMAGEFKGTGAAARFCGGERGGASRFFPTFHYEAKAPGTERPDVDGVQHPTVKPLELMRWLVRLVASPGAVILEPFAGSGTTLEACLIEGFHVIGIEKEAEYLPLIMQRIRKPLQQSLFGDIA